MKGRPTLYTPEIGELICEKIANSNKGLAHICEEAGMPHRSTIHEWIIKHEDFADKYARAKNLQADFINDEILEIADNVLEMTEKTEVLNADGSYTSATTKDNVQRARLMIDARKWQVSKLNPKKYGDKLDVTTDGEKLSAPKETFITLSNGTKIPL